MTSDGLRTVRAWIGVHAGRPALVLLAVSGLLSLLSAQAMISSLGFLVFETPVSLLLLVPVLAGIGVGMGTENTARIPLPEPLRLLAARLVWLLALTAAAGVAVSVGQLAGPAVDWQACLRNLLVHAALTVLAVTLVGSATAWVPSVALTLLCMFFGYPPSKPGYYWWAAVMEETVSPTQWAGTTALFLLAALVHVLHPRAAPHAGRFPLRQRPTANG
ncbi:hypothetical protein GCM10010329_37440 [Streptomyces spiroverticillatus]|uniref:Uncharacterized protein n=1 Tax=Streptomyces finlayi TaxID=67296 RepID=A0A918WYL8_9ACTN|nr:hypothetical protein [Streptomyces finlayi]GHA11071.1 hypothetical protein GCM10010329_37440 [Streptomyces spiroverticillatus]GHC95187.1 hypothetical protein GCM10010334_34170 [Streptomyces finlayi]